MKATALAFLFLVLPSTALSDKESEAQTILAATQAVESLEAIDPNRQGFSDATWTLVDELQELLGQVSPPTQDETLAALRDRLQAIKDAQ